MAEGGKKVKVIDRRWFDEEGRPRAIPTPKTKPKPQPERAEKSADAPVRHDGFMMLLDLINAMMRGELATASSDQQRMLMIIQRYASILEGLIAKTRGNLTLEEENALEQLRSLLAAFYNSGVVRR